MPPWRPPLQVAHHQKKFSPSPTLQIGGVFYIDVDLRSLINKKKMKNSLGLLIFCGGCADLMPFSTNLCKKAFLSRTERFGRFLFCFFYNNLGQPSAKSLQNGRLRFLFSRQKIEPVTTHKMASHLMDINILICQENMCLTDLNHYRHSKITFFEYALTHERISTVFSGVQPIAVTFDLCVRILNQR